MFCDPNVELQITVHDVQTNFVCPTEQIVWITKWVRVNGVDYLFFTPLSNICVVEITVCF